MATLGKKALAELTRDKVDVEFLKIKGWFKSDNMTNPISYGNSRYACINRLILACAHNKCKALSFEYEFEKGFDQLDIEELNSKLELLTQEQELHSIYIEREYMLGLVFIHKNYY